MKTKLLYLALFINLIYTTKTNATSINVSGIINTNTTWSADTVRVTGNVLVAQLKTLTILPGTIVEFRGFYKLESYSGAIKAIGTKNDSIRFTYFDTAGIFNNTINNGGWAGITIDDSYQLTNDSTIFDYCTMQYTKCVYDGTMNNFITGTILIQFNDKTRISNCSIRNNHLATKNIVGGPTGSNGVVNIWYCSPIIKLNKIVNNKSGSSGGIECIGQTGQQACNPIIDQNIVSYNVSEYMGAGVASRHTGGSITNNFITNNFSWGTGCGVINGGGGILVKDNSTVYIANNLIANNEGGFTGGGIKIQDNSNPTIVNNTIVNNRAHWIFPGGGGISIINSNATLINNIVWGNEDDNGPSQIAIQSDDSDPAIINCNIEYGIIGVALNFGVNYTGNYLNNMGANPLFINPSAGCGVNFDGLTNADFRLQLSSTSINAGTLNALGNLPSFDLWYNQRIQGYSIEIGAYEAPSEFNPNGINDFEDNSNLSVCPNPASNYFTLNYAKDYKQATITVVNTIGQVIETKTFSNSEKMNFDVSSFSKGIYFVNAVIDEKKASSKLIIE